MKDEPFCDEEVCEKCRESLEQKKEDSLNYCLECEKIKEKNKKLKEIFR
jgi:hypothetical protein